MAKKLKIEKDKKRTKWNLLGRDQDDKINQMLGFNIEMFSNQFINIDGCEGVTEYRDTYLNLRLIKGSVLLYGTDFDITFFENKTISVKGEIKSVEFCI